MRSRRDRLSARFGRFALLTGLSLCVTAGWAAAAGSDASGIPLVELKALIQPLSAGVRAPKPRMNDLVLSAQRLGASQRHLLPPLSRIERRRLEPSSQFDRRLPVGLVRGLTEEAGFRGLSDLRTGDRRSHGGGLLERSAGGTLSWTAAFSSAGAGALRLRLEDVELPGGSRAYVYSLAGEVHGPYDLAGAEPIFWTNTVFAEEIYLEIQLGQAGAAELANSHLSIVALGHLEHENFAPSRGIRPAAIQEPMGDECLTNQACVSASEFPNKDAASRAVAQLTFSAGGGFFLCTGALLNNSRQDFTPYLNTANHCISSQSSASSLEAFWDYTVACGTTIFPTPSGFPRTLGATLLHTSETNDFTLLRLSQTPPAGRAFLGWTTTDFSTAGGTNLYRVHHPLGRPQHYTRQQISSVPTPGACPGNSSPQGNYIYSKLRVGATKGGSSGAPVYTADLTVVGQLQGSCGLNISDDCDAVNNSEVDGAFRQSFSAIQQFLSPGPVQSVCTPGPNTICLSDNRFQVRATWTDSTGRSGAGVATKLSGDTGYFTFFDPGNVEMVVKVLNACSFSPSIWVFAGGLTNVAVTWTVTDTRSGFVKTYTNFLGTAFAPIQDTSAFATCP